MTQRTATFFSELRFTHRAFRLNVQNATELRSSFVLLAVGMMITNTSFVIVWGLFAHVVGEIRGWTFADVMLLQGITSFVYGVFFTFCAGIGDMPKLLLSGSFDRFLTTPKMVLARVALSRLSPQAVGDIIFALVCATYYCATVGATASQICLLFFASILAAVAMLGVATFIFSMSLYLYDGQIITDSLFQLFFSPAIMHGGAFDGWTRFFFLFAIPSLVVGTLPTELVDSFSFTELGLVSSLAVAWCLVGFVAFYHGLRRYESGNMQSFGE